MYEPVKFIERRRKRRETEARERKWEGEMGGRRREESG